MNLTNIPLPETKITEINIGGLSLQIEMVKDLNRYLDELTEQANEDEDMIPYWSEFWPSSIALSEYLLAKKKDLESKRIIEIGCGIGLIASFLTMQNIELVATDLHPLALELTQKNVLRNSQKEIRTMTLDWRFPDLKERFDVIIASDVIYESRSIKPLINVFSHLLNPGGKVYLAEPNRSVARPFFLSLRERGFVLSTFNKKINYQNKEIGISIYEIQ